MPMKALAIAALLVAAGSAATAAIPQEQLTRAIGATVFIKVERFFRNQSFPASGSGFFIDGKGHVLTNWHVVAPQIQLQLDGRDSEVTTTVGDINLVVNSGRSDERTLPAKVLRLDRARDLALLEVAFGSPSWLDVSAPPEVALTRTFLVLGYLITPARQHPEAAVTKGKAVSIQRDGNGEIAAFQLDAAIHSASSGGPVLDEAGAVVGVARAGAGGGAGAAFVVAPARLRAFAVDALRGGRDAANRSSSTNGAVGGRAEAQLPGNELKGQKPLSQLASGLKLRGSGDESGLVVTNSNLGRVAFVIVEARYVALPPELRGVAIEFDRAEFALGSLSVGITYGSGTVTADDGGAASPGTNGSFVGRAKAAAASASASAYASAGSDNGARPAGNAPAKAGGESYPSGPGEQISAARATLDAARAKVLQVGLCRCPDHAWFRSTDHASCQRCMVP